MLPEYKHNLGIAERAIHAVLSPLGFKKQKLAWRRHYIDVLQQFTLFDMQLGNRYRPEWGLNVLRQYDDPRPSCWKLQVRWIFEMQVANLPERLTYLECFKLERPMPETRRARLTTELLQKYVIPCFDMFATEESVRRMVADRKHSLRADSFVRLPKEWYPPDWPV